MGKVIDVHVHVGSSAALYVGGSIQIVTSRMSRHGITHSVVSPIPGFEDPEGIKSVKEMNAQAVAEGLVIAHVDGQSTHMQNALFLILRRGTAQRRPQRRRLMR